MGTLAPGYRTVLTGLRLYRIAVPKDGEIAQARARVSDWVARQRLPRTEGTIVRESPGWWTFSAGDSPATRVFYVHGGGLAFYSVEDFSSLMERFAAAGECEVTAFHYPKAPEHGPAEILETIAAQVGQRLAEFPPDAPVIFSGDSIGGYIALYMALRRFPGRFARLVLIYPVLDLQNERGSYSLYGSGFCLNSAMMSWFRSFWAGRPGGEFTPFGLTGEDRRNLPPTVVFSAEADVLRDESFDWCARLREDALPVQHHHMPDLAHDFCLYAGAIPEARAAVDLIAAQFRL